MSQSPLKVDQIQFEPGAVGTRLIRKASDGSLEFLDALVTSGLTLSQLAGLRNVQNLYVVGKAGAGAAYTKVQDALEAIPVGAGPSCVLIGPGVYRETINLVRDEVTLIGFGAVLQSLAEATPNGAGAYHTMVIQAALGTVPRKVTLVNLEITNAHNSYACIRVFGGPASEVGRTGIRLLNCALKATATGGNYPLWASSANFISLEGGATTGSHSTALLRVNECASLLLQGVEQLPALQLDYENTGDTPIEVAKSYTVSGCARVAEGTSLGPAIRSTLIGDGSLAILGCDGQPSLSLTGDRQVLVLGSQMGDITLAGSVALRLAGSTRGTVVAGGTATLAEPAQHGTAGFVASATAAVTFVAPHPNANYAVTLTPDARPVNDETPWVTAKAATGFTVNFFSGQTLGVGWSAVRN